MRSRLLGKGNKNRSLYFIENFLYGGVTSSEPSAHAYRLSP